MFETKGTFESIFDIDGKCLTQLTLDLPIPVELRECDLIITVDKWKEKRSTSANGLMWVCISQIAQKLNTDKWSVYIKMLKDYSGKFRSIAIREDAIEDIQKMYRASEVVGRITMNGQPFVQMNCYLGSSEMNKSEFSALTEGIISEMSQLGLETPEQRRLRMFMERNE